MSVHGSGLPGDANASQSLVRDAERDAAVDRLKRDYVEGRRLTLDESGDRMSLALESRTVGDLSAARLDLPEPLALPDALISGRYRRWAFLTQHRA